MEEEDVRMASWLSGGFGSLVVRRRWDMLVDAAAR